MIIYSDCISMGFPIGSDWLPFGTNFQIGKSYPNRTKIGLKSDIRFVADLDYFDQCKGISRKIYPSQCHFLS